MNRTPLCGKVGSCPRAGIRARFASQRHRSPRGATTAFSRGPAYFGNKHAASIYTNFTANPDLLIGISDVELRSVKLIVPRYYGTERPPATLAGISRFGHQYSDNVDTSPFGATNINYSKMPLSMWLDAWGVNLVPAPPQPAIAADVTLREAIPAVTDHTVWEALERLSAKSDVDLSDLYEPNGARRRPARNRR